MAWLHRNRDQASTLYSLIIAYFTLYIHPVEPEQINCIFKVSSLTYDLSRLAAHEWTIRIPESEGSRANFASFSLCNKTHSSPCGPVGVCVTDQTKKKLWGVGETMEILNQQISGIPWIARFRENNSSESFSTEISFLCSNEIGQPQYVSLAKNKLSLSWGTVAACPLKSKDAHTACSLEQSGLEQINLQPLRHSSYYSVNDSNGHQYFVNLCGGEVKNKLCNSTENEAIAVCDFDTKTNTSNILGFVSRQFVDIGNGISLSYGISKKKKSSKIQFVCNPKVKYGELKFKGIIDSMHTFEMESSFVCVSEVVDCTVFDLKGYKYDLSSLRDSSNQIVVDSRTGSKYNISVCRALSNWADSNCSVGAGVCKVNITDGNVTNSISLGSVSSGPRLNGKQLFIKYTDGSLCNATQRYQTQISFVCSKTDDGPALESVSVDCTYTFVWSTTAACPITSSVGKDCWVQDPLHGYTFDFTALRRANDYVLTNEDGNFRINVCGGLLEQCGGYRNSSVCLTDTQGNSFPIGAVATSPHIDDGRLSFVLRGSGCAPGKNSSTVHIIFICSHDAKINNSDPQYFTKDENCTFYFTWLTDIACANYSIHQCRVVTKNKEEYDLSPLSDPSYNYIILQNSTSYRKYFINVCRSVIFGHDAMCSSLTGICMINYSQPNNKDRFVGLGQASALQFDEAKEMLQLEYSDGDMCRIKDTSDGSYSSVINFICDQTEESSVPRLVEQDKCRYKFEWKTKYACPKKSGRQQNVGKCSVYNSSSRTLFDLNPLSKEEHIIENGSGEKFRLVACGSLSSIVTEKGAGICQQKENSCESMGIGNSDLIYDSRPLLNYTDGAVCAADVKKNTLIEFICDRNNSGPFFVDAPSNCTYNIHWYTDLACEVNVPCVARKASKLPINLSLLINNAHNYKVTVNGSDYFINICRSLLPVEGLSCFGGSGACKANRTFDGKWVGEMSMGYPHFSPEIFQDQVVLKYLSGSPCPGTKQTRISTGFFFTCDPSAGIGEPKLENMTRDCQYQFSWKTSVVCPNYEINFPLAMKTRILTNPENGLNINLTRLCSSEKYKVGDFFVQMCDEGTLCSVSKVQNTSEISYGSATSAVFSYSENVTKLITEHGDECKDNPADTYGTIINFRCKAEEETAGLLRLVSTFECSVEFEWVTPVACGLSESVHNDSPKNVVTTKSHVSTAGVIFGIFLALVACVLVLFLRKATNRNWCRSKLCNLFNKRHQGQFHYSMNSPDLSELETSSIQS